MTYRTGPCAFCSDPAVETCTRCGDAVCAEHGPDGAAHCRLCAKELADDLDLVAFKYRLGASPAVRDAHNRSYDRDRSFAQLLDPFRALGRFLAERGARKIFARRTRPEIEAWRLRAGIGGRSN